MDGLERNRLYRGVAEGYDSDGAAIVRVNGAVAFVPGAVRGEEVEFLVTRTRTASARGELRRVLTPSPRRTAPDCPYFGRCGGCAFRCMDYGEELWAKRQRVQDALTRLGGASADVESVAGAERPSRYRNKAQYPVSADGRVGFYRAGSHDVVDVRDCPLLPRAANRSADAVREWMSRYGATGYDERTGRGLVRHVYVRTNRRGESVCCIVANGKTLPREAELVGLVRAAAPDTVGVVVNANTRRDNVILGERFRTLWGTPYLYDTLRVPGPSGTRELTFRLSPASFYQVNPEQTEKLYALALDFASLSATETALDLYSGIGTITLSLGLWARAATGAEIVARAVSDAADNASRNDVGNVTFVRADATEMARRAEADGLRPDVVTVDPPRKGLDPDGIAAIADMGPSRVVYVSCDPGTLGRDVKRFAARGYVVRRAAAVDMFPRTRHVESVVLLSANDKER